MKTIQVDKKVITLDSIRSRVVGKEKAYETKIHGNGGGGSFNSQGGAVSDVEISSSTIVHDKIFLQAGEGKEYLLKLKNWDIDVREGNEILAIWLLVNGTRFGGEDGYIYVKNITTDKHIVRNESLGWASSSWYTSGGPRFISIFLVLMFLGLLCLLIFTPLQTPFSLTPLLILLASTSIFWIYYSEKKQKKEKVNHNLIINLMKDYIKEVSTIK